MGVHIVAFRIMIVLLVYHPTSTAQQLRYIVRGSMACATAHRAAVAAIGLSGQC